MSDLYIVDSGTVTTGNVLTYTTTNTGSIWVAHEPLAPPPRVSPIPPPVLDPFIKREFWDDVEWKEYTSYMPRKSITGKIIIGKMHKRSKKDIIKGGTYHTSNVTNTILDRAIPHTQYAKTKELFEEKLRGKA